MMTLITGGSGSGKSAYAEKYIENISRGMRKYYLATMRIYDAEGQKKARRHQEMRKGKGFATIEQPFAIGEALRRMEAGKKTALLECMSNLVANEMFDGERTENEEGAEGEERPAGKERPESQEKPKEREMVVAKVMAEIAKLYAGLEHLVIVTNNVFEDGICYDPDTEEYKKALGNINQRLAAMADEVIEVVVGIPVLIRKGSIQ